MSSEAQLKENLAPTFPSVETTKPKPHQLEWTHAVKSQMLGSHTAGVKSWGTGGREEVMREAQKQPLRASHKGKLQAAQKLI